MATKTPNPAGAMAVIRVASGNFLEMYDFMVFGYFAGAIGQTFFPGGDSFASLMKSLMTFGAAFLMRPLGAVILGACWRWSFGCPSSTPATTAPWWSI